MVCELSTGLSSEEEMVDDVTSLLYILGQSVSVLPFILGIYENVTANNCQLI